MIISVSTSIILILGLYCFALMIAMERKRSMRLDDVKNHKIEYTVVSVDECEVLSHFDNSWDADDYVDNILEQDGMRAFVVAYSPLTSACSIHDGDGTVTIQHRKIIANGKAIGHVDYYGGISSS